MLECNVFTECCFREEESLWPGVVKFVGVEWVQVTLLAIPIVSPAAGGSPIYNGYAPCSTVFPAD